MIGTMLKASLFILLLCASTWAIADQHDDIIWGINVSPPFHIWHGEYEKAGFCDTLVDTFERELPALSQSKRKLPSRRITMLMRKNQHLCFPCLIKGSDYNKDFIFSDATHVYPPHGVITTASNAQRFIKTFGEPLSFTALAQSDYRFAQPIERRYGELQPIIEDYLIPSEHFQEVSGEGAHMNLMAMVAAGRIDYTLDYKMLMTYFQRTEDQTNPDFERLVFIPIKENRDAVIIGAVGCSNNQWGQHAISNMNRVIEQVRSDSDFRQSLDLWLGADRPRPEFNNRN